MRNLKKLFAVVMIVAMLASMMVPALAADYNNDAAALKDLGLFQGYSDTDLGLDDNLTREQGLALMLRVMGLEGEVKAMTEEEIAAELAKVVDPETITDTWAKPYVAYAVQNGLTKGIDGSILPNVKFAGKLNMTGKEFINLMLNGMGYNTGWDDVLTKAAEVEMLSAGDAVTFGTITVLNRDYAVGVMANALTGITSEGISLAQALVDAGAVDADKMEEYGFIAPVVVPTEAPVEFEATATADNLVQLYVEFNAPVDKDSAEDKGNYDIDKIDIADASLQDDGVTVILTLDFLDVRKEEIEQQDVLDLVIDGVKSLDGSEMDEYAIDDIVLLDTTIPTAIDAQVVGNDTIKVIFSEPVDGDYDASAKAGERWTLNKKNFEVNNGKTYIRKVKLQNNNTEALVELYNNLKEGEITIKAKSDTKDFAGFGVIVRDFTLEVVPDEEAPVVVGYEKASRTEVTLIWNEDIEFNGKMDFTKETVKDSDRELFYHTNSKNPVRQETDNKDGTTNEAVEIDGNKMTLYFDDDTLLHEGTAYVYVSAKAVRDLWDNENDQQMTRIEVEIDETPPEVDKIDVKAEDKIEIKFTEELDADTAKKKANYTILDADGDEIKNIIDKVSYSSKKVTITFEEDLNGDYSIVIENIKDNAQNKMEKTTVDFNVGDKTAPVADNFKATLYNSEDEDQMIRIDFDDKMATDGSYSVADVEKYVILKSNKKDQEARLEDVDDVDINVVNDGKSVEIFIPSSVDVNLVKNPKLKSGEDYQDIVDGYYIQIGRVADAAGNKMGVMFVDVEINESVTIDIDKVEAKARDTIEITFKDEVSDFEEDDIEIFVNGVAYDKEIAGVTTKLNSDGNTVVVYTLDDDYLLNPDLVDSEVIVWVDGDESTNIYGKKLTQYGYELDANGKIVVVKDEDGNPVLDADGNEIPVVLDEAPIKAKDKIKPELADDTTDKNKAKAFFEDLYADATKNDDVDYTDNTGRYVKDYFALAPIDYVEVRPTVAGFVYNFVGKLVLNEKVEEKAAYTSIGSDFIVKIDGKQIYNEIDYVVEIVDEKELKFFFKAKDDKKDDKVVGYKLDGDLEIELVAKPNYIVDGKGNTIAPFDTIEVDNIDFYFKN